jgi:ectoine hydroxylase-related dioxygenase (phytanoyl-CoA dioxygenase family)
MDVHREDPVFRELAVSSPLAAAAAQLTPAPSDSVKTDQRALCVLRDAYFRMCGKNTGCNFHVDDAGFWPCTRDSPGPGVNVWVALDEVGEDGGGLAVARASHTEEFLDCREAIRANTCMIHQLAPESAQRLEAVRDVPKMKPGDAIICTRFMFHRADPFVAGSEGESGPGVGRYSVRYMPGEAVVTPMRYVDGKIVGDPAFRLSDGDNSLYPAVQGCF